MIEKATFGMGCFWGPEEYFANLPGVTKTEVGYMGGDKEDVSYDEVLSGVTGHTEVVQIVYTPEVLVYEELLEHFWKKHNPTNEEKVQYQSIIFYHNDAQKEAAVKSRKEKQQELEEPITTQIKPVQNFSRAEEYHQRYLAKEKGTL